MATPRPAAPVAGEAWNGPSQPMPGPAPVQEPGVQVRSMGLKVHYTFDKEARVNCLARYPHTLHVQTIPVDESNVIGVVDLRACLQAVVECSPELAAHGGDYTIYAIDYSEPDTPLVGQGMLSWALDSMRGDTVSQNPKLITGRVTKNLLAVFGGGNRETLEVRLKMAESAIFQRHARRESIDTQQTRPMDRPMEMAGTPTATSEWNSFIQSNPQVGHIGHVSHLASPALPEGPPPMALNRQESFGPLASRQDIPPTNQEVHRVAPTLVEPGELPKLPAAPSRSSSRASNRAPRRKQPTGRPRGRPRKKPVDGSTSTYEDATEGEEGPVKKRAKTTKVDRSAANPFASGPESLRVAASTSGSLRTFRPIAANNGGAPGSHLQEVPRAPTPVPGAGPFTGLPGRGPKHRQESALSQHQAVANDPDSRQQSLSPGQEDGRSPDSTAQTPAYSDGSMGSSPPVQLATTPFLRSSPPPSSPVLPPMPHAGAQNHGSGLANDEMDDLFGEQPHRPAPREAMPTHAHLAKSIEPATPLGIPIQVFQMQEGPTGQDMVFIHSYDGARHPASATQPPASADGPSLPPSKKDPPRPRTKMAPAKRKSRAAPRPAPSAMAPTPPPTTDAVDGQSPMPMAELAQGPVAASASMQTSFQQNPMPIAGPVQCNGQRSPAAVAEPMQGVVQLGEANYPLANSATEPATTREAPVHQQNQPSKKAHQKKNSQGSKPRALRPFVRCQSAEAAALALPSIPASEPARPSSSSRSTVTEPDRPTLPAAFVSKRAASSGPLALPVPASDPVGPNPSLLQHSNRAQSETFMPPSDAVPPTSSPPPAKSNKNVVKKHAIKQRLEEAIMNGEMPPFCSNCGAIETPTWRKIWVQDRDGTPEYCEYSEKPGKVTAIEIMKRDAEEKPTAYRLVKKSLGPTDNKSTWQELLLCNPCGIWLTKCKCHRPTDRWDKDLSRIGQERKRKGTGNSNSRSKKTRSKGDAPIGLTSEAYLMTDALGPVEVSSPKATDGRPLQADMTRPQSQHSQEGFETRAPSADVDSGNHGSHSNTESSHSQASGTAQSPMEREFDEAVGSTRRLLFPSPIKDGVPKVLGEVDVNIVQISDAFQQLKQHIGVEKENTAVQGQDGATGEYDDLELLFKSPTVARPSTPPPNATAEPPPGSFKTPTRSAAHHRPITRSVSRSLRSIKSIASPSQALLQLTPTKTPRAASGVQGSMGRRRSPRNHHGELEAFDTPLSRTLTQIFSDHNNFGLVDDLDLTNLPTLDANANPLFEFTDTLGPAGEVPSPPFKDSSAGYNYHASVHAWPEWTMDGSGNLDG